MLEPKPLLLGYQVRRVDTSEEHLRHGRALMETFAAAEGFTLEDVRVLVAADTAAVDADVVFAIDEATGVCRAQVRS